MTSLDDLHDARPVASARGFPHYIVNFERQFRDTVISNFVSEYTSGRTPIPCSHCNSDLKLSTLLDRARGLGADHLATGHYARVEETPDGRYRLRSSSARNRCATAWRRSGMPATRARRTARATSSSTCWSRSAARASSPSTRPTPSSRPRSRRISSRCFVAGTTDGPIRRGGRSCGRRVSGCHRRCAAARRRNTQRPARVHPRAPADRSGHRATQSHSRSTSGA